MMSQVVVVDDDPAIRELLLEVLRGEGYDVLEAGNGAAGVQLVQTSRPDLVIMDLRMPVMTGVEAIRLLKDDPATQPIPILAMSAGTVLRAQAAHLPVEGMIDKPFDLDALLARVSLHLSRNRRPSSG